MATSKDSGEGAAGSPKRAVELPSAPLLSDADSVLLDAESDSVLLDAESASSLSSDEMEAECAQVLRSVLRSVPRQALQSIV